MAVLRQRDRTRLVWGLGVSVVVVGTYAAFSYLGQDQTAGSSVQTLAARQSSSSNYGHTPGGSVAQPQVGRDTKAALPDNSVSGKPQERRPSAKTTAPAANNDDCGWKPDDVLVGSCGGSGPKTTHESKKMKTAEDCAALCCRMPVEHAILEKRCVSWQFREDTGCKVGGDVRVGMEKDGPSAWCGNDPPGRWFGQRITEATRAAVCGDQWNQSALPSQVTHAHRHWRIPKASTFLSSSFPTHSPTPLPCRVQFLTTLCFLIHRSRCSALGSETAGN
jgi:hypothetical protein